MTLKNHIRINSFKIYTHGSYTIYTLKAAIMLYQTILIEIQRPNNFKLRIKLINEYE